MRFISLKTDSSNFSYIEDVFKTLFGNYIKSEKLDDYMFIYNKEFNINELTDTIQALELDLDSPISIYIVNYFVNLVKYYRKPFRKLYIF